MCWGWLRRALPEALNLTSAAEKRASRGYLAGKESACNAGRSPGEGNGNPLRASCLENSMDGGAWWAVVHRVAKSRTWLSEKSSTDGMSLLIKEIQRFKDRAKERETTDNRFRDHIGKCVRYDVEHEVRLTEILQLSKEEHSLSRKCSSTGRRHFPREIVKTKLLWISREVRQAPGRSVIKNSI